MGIKVTAAQIGIDRVTLWRVLNRGIASQRTLRLIDAFATTATFIKLEKRNNLCIVTA